MFRCWKFWILIETNTHELVGSGLVPCSRWYGRRALFECTPLSIWDSGSRTLIGVCPVPCRTVHHHARNGRDVVWYVLRLNFRLHLCMRLRMQEGALLYGSSFHGKCDGSRPLRGVDTEGERPCRRSCMLDLGELGCSFFYDMVSTFLGDVGFSSIWL